MSNYPRYDHVLGRVPGAERGETKLAAPCARPISEITRDEWIAFQWYDITRVGDPEARFVRGYDRDPADAWQRGQEWDNLQEARMALGIAA